MELHVHLEGTVRAGTLLQIAGRNGIALPADSEAGLAGLYEFRDFAHFVETWLLDVCPISNLRTGVVASLAAHPLPDLVAAGVRCSVSTDDPAMFGTDLSIEYQAASRLGVLPGTIYQAGLHGALCDEETSAALRRAGEACDWAAIAAGDQAT
jgi:aminodeoxyfutalosine deaminase